MELDGDLAWVETYCVSMSCLPAVPGKPRTDRHARLRYRDRFERLGGEWKIAHRIVVWGSSRIDAVKHEDELTDRHRRELRDRSDPAYRAERERAPLTD